MNKTKLVVSEVKTKKDRRDFIAFPIKLFKNVKNYCPCFHSDEVKILNGTSQYNKESLSYFIIARRGKKIVGRLSVIIQNRFNEKSHLKQARFTRFDVIDDIEVSKALFLKGEEWARMKGMDTIVGPLDYSDFEREGLLIEGFEEYMTFEEQYHPPYYQKHIEALGFHKDVDWYEFQITKDEEAKKNITKLANAVRRFSKVRLADTNMSKKKYLNKYKNQFFEVINECYKDLYGTTVFSDEAMNDLIKNFSPLLKPNYIPMVVDENDRVVATAIVFPSISKIIKRSKGRLTPFAILSLLKTVRKPRVIDLGLIAVRPEYQKTGINVLFLEGMYKLLDEGVEFCETNLNLETNTAVITQWKHFNARQHKKRRCYKKSLF